MSQKPAVYSDKLKSPLWQRKRLEVMQRYCFKCRLCGDTETSLHIHHLEYSGEPWQVDNDKLITICEDCHYVIEDQKINLINDPHAGIIKIKSEGVTTLFLVSDLGLSIYKKIVSVNKYFCLGISHKAFSKTIHQIINYWLQTDNQHLLIDKKIQ
jgi:hypothetical protein